MEKKTKTKVVCSFSPHFNVHRKGVPLRAHNFKYMQKTKMSHKLGSQLNKSSGASMQKQGYKFAQILPYGRVRDGNLVFGNPATQVAENTKAKHPISEYQMLLNTCSTAGSRGGHSVFGNLATQVPENPKAKHSTPVH